MERKEKFPAFYGFAVALTLLFAAAAGQLCFGGQTSADYSVSARQSVSASVAEAPREESAEAPSRGIPQAGKSDKIDINTADASELERLTGIGPALAQAIVAYRSEHGPFARPEDLMLVKGIGEKRFAAICGEITTEGEQP